MGVESGCNYLREAGRTAVTYFRMSSIRRIVVLLALLGSCRSHPQERLPEQAARLRSAFGKYRAEYLASIDAENRLIAETLLWLNGNAVTAPRAEAAAEARRLMDRWARVYFVPRYMHAQLRLDRYSPPIQAVQQRLLERLKRRYFELHDYQRYAQSAWESGMHNTRAGRLPKELEEFRSRLGARAPAVDELWPLLDSLDVP